MLTQTAIETFGDYDYERLSEMGADDVHEIEDIQNGDLKKIADLLNDLIKKNKLYLMDKETGVAFEASVVIGFSEGGLLIANER